MTLKNFVCVIYFKQIRFGGIIVNLNGQWKLYYAKQGEYKINSIYDLKTSKISSVPCTVPGNVELDLSKAGILPEDLFKGENILKAEEFEQYEWWYETEFTAPKKPEKNKEMILNFRAVDCCAEYFLNGQLIGVSDNMFIANEFDVTDLLAYEQINTLHVHITSATIKGMDFESDLYNSYFNWQLMSVHWPVRKAPHSYGWDIMPRAVSAGIWRDVTLDERDKYRFDYVYFSLEDVSTGKIRMCYDTKMDVKYAFRNTKIFIKGKCGDSEFEHSAVRRSKCGRIDFFVPDLKLWWPKFYGEPNLYDITVTITDMELNELMSISLKQGFRTLQLKRSDVIEEGGAFEFVINGVKIMANGSNWVPMDAYHSRDKERLKAALDLADDIGCNILRCWGGNVYEDHEFFDYCDSHGIMVWQDFAMACNVYSNSRDFEEKIKKEATWVVKEYRNHCSIVLWSGDNEIDTQFSNQGTDPAINKITREFIPEVLAAHDPKRPYVASSPYISSAAHKAGYALRPEEHLWGPRDYYKSSYYADSKAYFVSETGYHGCPSVESIKKFIDEDKVWPYADNSQWTLHSSDQNGSSHRVWLMHNQVAQMFGKVPADMEEYVLASQISQAEAKKFFIERVRSKMNYMGGVIWWNLIDGWPQMSDAVVDYYYDKKLAFDFIKRSSRDFIIMFDEMNNWGHEVICCNSSLKEFNGKCTIIDLDTEREVFSKEFKAGANKNTKLGKVNIMYSKQTMYLIKWTLDNGEEYYNTYLAGMPGFDLNKYKEWLSKLP
ncbi:MAG: hypothetical protein E7565_08935 [Ruminococcaceae bacterium]|nr:hypothetical protein [Oscillospiraceae bacterium]